MPCRAQRHAVIEGLRSACLSRTGRSLPPVSGTSHQGPGLRFVPLAELPIVVGAPIVAVNVGNTPAARHRATTILGGGELAPTKTDATTITGVCTLRAQPPAR